MESLLFIKINGNFWDWLDKELKEKTFILDEVDFLMRYDSKSKFI